MESLINGSLVTSKTREAFLERLEIDRRSSETWELIRKGIIKVHGFKIGDRVGFVAVVECESKADVEQLLSEIVLVQEGWFEIEIDPISRFYSDLR